MRRVAITVQWLRRDSIERTYELEVPDAVADVREWVLEHVDDLDAPGDDEFSDDLELQQWDYELLVDPPARSELIGQLDIHGGEVAL